MKVIQNKLIPFKGFKYINLFGLILTRDKSKITDEIDARDVMVAFLYLVFI